MGPIDTFRASSIAIGPDRPRLAIAIFLAVLIGALEALLLFSTGRLVTTFGANDATGKSFLGNLGLGSPIVLAIVVAIALIVLAFPFGEVQASLSERAIVRFRKQCLDAFLHASVMYRSAYSEGFFSQLIGEYCNHAESGVQQIVTFCVTSCSLAVLLVVSFITSPRATLAMTLIFAATALLFRFLFPSDDLDGRTITNANTRISAHTAQTARIVDDITVFDATAGVLTEVTRAFEVGGEALRAKRLEGKLMPNLYLYVSLLALLILFALLNFIAPGARASATPLALISLRAVIYARQVFNAAQTLSENLPYVALVNNEAANLRRHRVVDGNVAVASFETLELKDVGFRYPSGRPVLHGLNLELRAGEALALVGPSGSGKSTLCTLLARLRPPTSGSIDVDGIALKDIRAADWSRLIALVPQDCKLIAASVADNIRFFHQDLTSEEVEAAARNAHIHDEIAALPNGYDTILGPSGRSLSGGQRQRLAIARALIHKPKLLILDEPTSALDERSEELIAQTLTEQRGKVAILIATHRTKLLGICDRVMHLSAGDEGAAVRMSRPETPFQPMAEK